MDKRLRPLIFNTNTSNSESSSKCGSIGKTYFKVMFRESRISLVKTSLICFEVYWMLRCMCISAKAKVTKEAIRLLDSAYIKPVHKIYARHQLNTSKQKGVESLQDFYQMLKKLSADCNYAAVSAVQNREAVIRHAFIAGLFSGYIRQRLQEENAPELRTVFAIWFRQLNTLGIGRCKEKEN